MSSRPTVAWVPVSTDARVASARLRCLIPCRYLTEAGWDCVISTPERVRGQDVVIFQKAYEDNALQAATRLKQAGSKIVFDLCDNHLYDPDGNAEHQARAKRLHQMLEIADLVSVSTTTLRSVLEGTDAVVIDDALDLPFNSRAAALYGRVVTGPGQRHPTTLVWYGNAGSASPSFGMRHLRRILPTLELIFRERPFELTVISNSRSMFKDVLRDSSFPSHYVPWRRSTFTETFRSHDLCVIPLEVNPFTMCKTGNRVAQSLALKVPVIADPIPSFEEFADFILLNDWEENLRRYLGDPALRHQHASEGSRYVRSTWTKQRVVSQWSALIERVVDGPTGAD